MTRDEQWVLTEKYAGIETPEFEADKRRLALGEPVAYVIGYQPFLGLKIYLDSKPLIPRPETEWWTEQLLEKINPDVTVLDVCAGSGAIGCAALARLPRAKVYFGELNPAHESTIRKNIRENHLDESRADIRIGDLFAPFGDMAFDVIAANPPYIPEERTLEPSVSAFEPYEALFAGRDGLSVMRRIAAELPQRLTPAGVAWLECDSAHAEAAQELFAASGMQSEIANDQYGKPRLIRIRHH